MGERLTSSSDSPRSTRFANHVQNAAQSFFADWDGNHIARVSDRNAPHQSFRAVHGNAADGVFPEVLGDFEDQVPVLITDSFIL